MLDNYPAGALNDRNAPYAQPEISDECRYDHPDGEICQLVAELDCPYCEKRVCSEAITIRRLYGPGGVLTVEVCESCALKFMVPKAPDLAIYLLRRAVKYSVTRPGSTWAEIPKAAWLLGDCIEAILNSLKSESHERTEAVLRVVEAA